MSGFDVVPATEVPEGALHDFYDVAYGARSWFRKQHWRWLYRAGEAGPIAPLLAVRDGVVYGQAAPIPVTLARGGDRRPGAWYVDFAIRPELQRQGLGKLLTERWMAQAPLHVTFCNEKSIGVFLKYGWTERFHTRSFVLPLRPERHPGLRASPKRHAVRPASAALRALFRLRSSTWGGVRVSPLASADLGRFLSDAPAARLHTARTREYLEWRFLRHPLRDQLSVLTYEGGSSSCSAVIRFVEQDGYRRLHLLMVGSTPEQTDGLGGLLAGAVGHALERRADHVWMVSSVPRVGRIVRTWLPAVTRMRFACHAADPAGAAFLSGEDHAWEAHDSDTDLYVY